MLKKIGLLLSAAASLAFNSYAQQPCKTDEVYHKLIQQHPEVAVYEEQLETAIRTGVSNRTMSQFARTTNDQDTFVYDIPIVIHVVHDYGVEFLQDTTILNAVAYWTEVDLGQNYSDTNLIIPTFKPYIGNPRIHLHLATKDPDGNATRGIVRHHSYLTANGGDESKLGDWPHDKYVNIWFVNTFGAANAGAAAYAYYPASGAGIPYYDGVICLYNYIAEDKTIPHELGHVFNLRHVWGNNNNAAVACGGSDLVDDTPPTKGHLFDCNTMLYDTACATGNIVHYHFAGTNTDSVVIDYPDTTNTQNIMDYSGCMEMFTKGQAVRMRAALANNTAGRSNLWSPTNLALTGALDAYPDLPPVAEFSVEKARTPITFTTEKSFFLCANSTTSFVFKNRSWNDTVSSVQWTFSNGATTSTSTKMDTILNRFSQPGWVTVTLAATSNAGVNTVTQQAVYVADTVAINPYNYVQEFSVPSAYENWPMFNYYDNNFKWETFDSAGFGDNSCIRYKSYDYRSFPENTSGTPVGDHDDMFTPGFDLSDTTGPVYLNFHTAGAKLSGQSSASDTLEIWSSNTCGMRWGKIASLSGSQLSNAGVKPTEYIPVSDNEWKAQTITVPAAYRTSRTYFRFRYRPGDNGNNFYFDKFSVSGVSTEVKEVMSNPSLFKVYPNPAHNGCNIAFMTGADGNAHLEIADVTGKIIYVKDMHYAAHSAIEERIPAEALPAAGMYFVTVSNSGRKMTQKLINY